LGGVSRFRVKPVSLASPEIADLPGDMLSGLGLCTPIINPDGSYTVNLPCAGRYRLLVDLYDESVPPIPQLLVDVPAEGKETTITLPDPLVTVPSGTELQWVTLHAPTQPQCMIASGYHNPMPIFGPQDATLAYWFRPTPDTLRFCMDGKTQTVFMRAGKIKLQDANGNPFLGQASLLPLLPSPAEGNTGNAANPSRTFPLPCNIPQDGMTLDVLWEEMYLLALHNNTDEYGYTSYPRLYPVDFSAGKPETMVTIPAQAPKGPNMLRNLRLAYGNGDREALRPGSTEYAGYAVAVLDDGNQPLPLRIATTWNLNDGTSAIHIPATTQKITFLWPGVGVTAPLAVPADDVAPLVIPAFAPGTSLTGKIIQADGKPFANKAVFITMTGLDAAPYTPRKTADGAKENTSVLLSPQAIASFPSMRCVIQRVTDAQGAFEINGVVPGTVFVSMETNPGARMPENLGDSWTLNVPEKGLTDITLRASATPVVMEFNQG
jgi:hypothetical protein